VSRLGYFINDGDSLSEAIVIVNIVIEQGALLGAHLWWPSL
jgi:hypothetical protein